MFSKEPAILITTHGRLCEGILDSLKMLYGKVENVEAVSLKEGMDPKEYEAILREKIDSYQGDVILLVDFSGGTPFNTIMKISRDRELYAVAGVNMPMVFKLMEERANCRNGRLLAEKAEKDGREYVKDITDYTLSFYEKAHAAKD